MSERDEIVFGGGRQAGKSEELETALWKAREEGLRAIQSIANQRRFAGDIFVAAFLESVVKFYRTGQTNQDAKPS